MSRSHVCGNCFRDEAIKRFVQDNAVSDRCDFCTFRSDYPIAALWESVLAFIREGLETCWVTPIDDFDEEGRPLEGLHDTRDANCLVGGLRLRC
jgi:hypothetical protein